MLATIRHSPRRTLVPALAFACGLLPAALTAQAPPYATALDAFRDRLRADVAADTIGGITAALVIGDRMVWAEGFGWSDRHAREPAGLETIYRIGSISKSLTAMLLGVLVDGGIVQLDDPVEKYLPEVRELANPRPGAKPITLRQLASHTAGIIREPRLDGAATGPITQWEQQLLASIPATSFDTVPGARYAYSNIGFGLLGLALSRAARVPFIELVEREIFQPLQMRSSTYVVSDAQRQQLSVGYANNAQGIDKETPAREHSGRGYKVPNGGVYSTVADLARFIAAMTKRGPSILSDSIRSQLLTVQTPERRDGSYGLGFQLSVADSVLVAGHGGSVAGYTAHIAFDPASGVGVILLRNYDHGATNLLASANELVLAVSRALSKAPLRH